MKSLLEINTREQFDPNLWYDILECYSENILFPLYTGKPSRPTDHRSRHFTLTETCRGRQLLKLLYNSQLIRFADCIITALQVTHAVVGERAKQ